MPPDDTKRATADWRSAAGESIDLIRRYVLQETVQPLRQIGWKLLVGAAGGLFLGIGLVLLLLAVLRALQTETGSFFAGDMSFGPYLATCAVAVGIIGVAALVLLRMISKGGRR